MKLNYLNIMNLNLEMLLYFMSKFLIKVKILYLKFKFKVLFCTIKIFLISYYIIYSDCYSYADII